MDIGTMIVNFFKGLVRSRVSGVQTRARGQAYNVQARARTKAANAFNSTVDSGVDKAKAKATGRGRQEDEDGEQRQS